MMAWLERAGLDLSMAQRVVIDIPCDDAVRIYIQQVATERLLEGNPPAELALADVADLDQADPVIAEGMELYGTNRA